MFVERGENEKILSERGKKRVKQVLQFLNTP